MVKNSKVAGLLTPSAGSVAAPETVSCVFQEHRLIPQKTLEANIDFVLRGPYPDKKRRKAVIKNYLALARLTGARNMYPEQLSGGMKGRAALIRAFAYPAPALFLDEPFKGLDIQLHAELMDALEKLLAEDPRTVIFITHNIEEAVFAAGFVYLLGDKPLEKPFVIDARETDGVTDLFAGYIVDNTKTRFGKGRPYEFCILGIWVSTILMFACPDLGLVGKSIWIFFTYTLVQSVFATLRTPGGMAYAIRAWPNKRVLIKQYSYGGIVTTLGAITVSISFPMAMRAIATSVSGWTRLVLIYAIPLAAFGMLRFIFVKELYNLDAPGSSTEKVKPKEIFAVLKSNHYIWVEAGVILLAQIYAGMNVGAYYFTWIVGNIGKYGAIQGITVIMLVFLFIFPKMMKKFSVPDLITMGAVSGIIGCLLNFFAGSNMVMLGVALLFIGFASLPTSYLLGIMVYDCSVYNEWKGLPRLEAAMSSINNFGSKIGNGIGTAFLGLLLGAAGYNGALSE
jgi:Na+/melibiose symporter-like transporter